MASGNNTIQVTAKVVLDQKALTTQINNLIKQVNDKLQNAFSGKKFYLRNFTIDAGNIKIASNLGNKIIKAIQNQLRGQTIKLNGVKIDQSSLQNKANQIGSQFAKQIIRSINSNLHSGAQIKLTSLNINTNGIQSFGKQIGRIIVNAIQSQLSQASFNLNGAQGGNTGNPIPSPGASGGSGGGGASNNAQAAQIRVVQTEMRKLIDLYTSANRIMTQMRAEVPGSMGFDKLQADLDTTAAKIKTIEQAVLTARTMFAASPLTDPFGPNGDAGLIKLANNLDVGQNKYQNNLANLKSYTSQVRLQIQELQSIYQQYQQSTETFRRARSLSLGSSEYNTAMQDARSLRATADQLKASYDSRYPNNNQASLQGAALNEVLRISQQINAVRTKGADIESRISQSMNRLAGDYQNVLARMQAFSTKNQQNLAGEAGRSLNGLIAQTQSAINNKDFSTAGLDAVKKRFSEIQLAATQAQGATQGFGSSLWSVLKNMAMYAGINQVFMAISQSIRSMINDVHELDTAMTELRKVTDASESTYQQVITDAGNKAIEIGSTMTEVINSTSEFARLGYSIKDAFNLGEAATVFSAVGDDIADSKAAADSIISAMAAYKIEAKDAMSIVDKFNEVGNNYSSSSGDIAAALTRSAAALSQAGNSIDESIALVVSGNQVTRNADIVGTALKTLSLRLTSTKVELEAMGEDGQGAAESISKLRDTVLALTNQKVDILDGDKYKNTYEILKEIAAEWDNIAHIDQQALMELLGGKLQANVLMSIVDNFQTAENVLGTSLNSMGSAARENEAVLESMDGKLAQFKSSVQQLSSNIFDSDALKGFIDFGRGVVNVFNEMAEKGLAIPAIIGAITAALAAFNKAALFSVDKQASFTRTFTQWSANRNVGSNFQTNAWTNQLQFMGRSLNDWMTQRQYSRIFNQHNLTGANRFVSQDDIGLLDTFNKKVLEYNQNLAQWKANGSIAGQQPIFNLQQELNQLTGLGTAAKTVAEQMNQTGAATEKMVISTKSLQVAAQGGTAAMIGMKIATMALSAAVSMGIAMLVQLAFQGIDYLIHWNENQIKEANEVIDKWKDIKQSTDDEIKNIKSVRDEFNELATGVDSYGRNISLSTDEYARYQEIVQGIVADHPSLIAGYDEENNVLAEKNTLLERAIELQQREQDIAKREYLDKGNEIAEGVRAGKQDIFQKVLDQVGELDKVLKNVNWTNLEYSLLRDFESSGYTDLRDGTLEYLQDLQAQGKITAEELNECQSVLDSMALLDQEIDSNDSNMRNYLQIYASDNATYKALSAERQDIANRLISNMDVSLEGKSLDDLKTSTLSFVNAIASLPSDAFDGFDSFMQDINEGTLTLENAEVRIRQMGTQLANSLGVEYDEAIDLLGLDTVERKLQRLKTRIEEIDKTFPSLNIMGSLKDSTINATEDFNNSIGKLEVVYGKLSSIPTNVMESMTGVFLNGTDVDLSNVYSFISALQESQLTVEQIRATLESVARSSTGFFDLTDISAQVDLLNQITSTLGLTADDAEQIDAIWKAMSAPTSDGGMGIGSQLTYLNKAFDEGKINASTYDAALQEILKTLGAMAGIDMSNVFDTLNKSMNAETLSKTFAEANKALKEFFTADVGVRQFMTSALSAKSEAIEEQMQSAVAAHDVGAYSDLSILKQQLDQVASIANDPIGRVSAVFEAVNAAMKDMQSTGTLTLESFKGLSALGPEFASAMDVSAGGVRANTDALQELTRAEIDQQRAQVEALKSRDYDQLSKINAELNNLIGTNRELTGAERERVDQLLGERDTIMGLIDTYDAMTAALEQAAGARAQLANALEMGSKADVANIWKEGYEKAKEYLQNGQIGDAKNILRNMVSADVDLSTPQAIAAAFERLQYLAKDTSDIIGVLYGQIANQTAAGAFDGMLSHAERFADGSIQLRVYEQELENVAKALGISTDMLRDFIAAQSAWSLDDGALNIGQVVEDLRTFDGVVSDVQGRVTVNLEALKAALSGAGWNTNDINKMIVELSQAEDIDLTDASGQILNFIDAAQSAHSSDYWKQLTEDIKNTGTAISNLDNSKPVNLMTFLQNLAAQGKYTKEQIAGITGSMMTEQGFVFEVEGRAVGMDEVEAAIKGIEVTWNSTKGYIESNGVQLNVDTDPSALAALAGDTATLQNWLDLARQSGDTVAVEKLEMAIEYSQNGNIDDLTAAARQSLDALKAKLQEVFKLKMQGAWGINTAMPLIAKSKQVVNDLYIALTKLQNFKVKINVDYSGLNNAKNAANNLKNALNTLPKTLTTTHTITTNYRTTGYSSTAAAKASGAVLNSDNASTRFATGTRNAKRETALVNDGTPVNGSAGELIIRKDSSEAFIANGGRLAMVDLFPGDVVLTARETQDVLQGNRASDELRFKRYSDGGGSGGISSTWRPNQTTQTSSKPSSSSSSKPSSSSSSGSSTRKPSSSSSSSSSQVAEEKKAAEETEDLWKKAFENQYKYFKYMLDMKYMSEMEYFDKVDALWREYFAGREEYLDEQRQYEVEVFQGRLSQLKTLYDKDVAYFKYQLEMKQIQEEEYWNLVEEADQRYIANNEHLQEEHRSHEAEIFNARLNLVKSNYDKEIDYLQYQLDMELIDEKEFYTKRKSIAERYFKDNINFVEEWRDAEVAAHKAVYELLEARLSKAEKALSRELAYGNITQSQYDNALYNLRVLTYKNDPHYEEEMADAAVDKFNAELDRKRKLVEEASKEIERQVKLNILTREQADKALYRLVHTVYGTQPDQFKSELADANVSLYESQLTARTKRVNDAIKKLEQAYKKGEIKDQATLDKLKAQVTHLLYSKYPEAFKDEIEDSYVDEWVAKMEQRAAELQRQLTKLKHLYDRGQMEFKDYIEETYKLSMEAYGTDAYFDDEREQAITDYYTNRKQARLDAYNEELADNERQHDLGLRSDQEYLQKKIDLWKQYLRGDKRFKEEAADTEVSLHKDIVNQAKADYEKELKLLENSYDMGEIATMAFYQKRLEIAEKYLGGIKELEDDLADVYKQTYEDRVALQKEYWERALAGVEYAIDNEIKKREKARDAETEPYNKLIKELQKEAKRLQKEQSQKQRTHDLELRPYDHEIRDLQRREKELTIRYKRLIRPYQDAQREKQKEQEKLQRAQELELRPLERELRALDRQSTWIEKMYDDRLYPLQQELKMLQKIEETKEDELAVDEARFKLAKAMTERPNLVYREGLGFVYEKDKSAIREAQKDQDKNESDKRIKELQDLIEKIEEEREAELRPIDDRSWWLNWWSEDINDKYSALLQPVEDWLYDMSQFLDELDWQQTITLRPIQDRLEDLEVMRDDINYIYERASEELNDALYEVNEKLDIAQDELDAITEKYEAQINNLNAMKDILQEQQEYWEHILDLQIAQKVFGEEAWRDFNMMLQESNEAWNQALADRVQGFSDLYSDLFALAGKSLNDYEGLINKTFDVTELRADVLAQKLKDFQAGLISAAEYMDYLNQYQWNQNKQEWLPSVDSNNMTTSVSPATKPTLPNMGSQQVPTVNNPTPQQPTVNPSYDSNQILSMESDIQRILREGQILLNRIAEAEKAVKDKKQNAVSNLKATFQDVERFLRQNALTAKTASDKKLPGDSGTSAMVLLAKLASSAKLNLGSFYASGRKSGSVSELAVTQESGPEAIMHTTKGQFTLLSPKDMVFSNRQTENLWNLSQLNPVTLRSSLNNAPKPNVTSMQSTNQYSINVGDVIVQSADNPEALSRAIINRLPNQILQDMSRR